MTIVGLRSCKNITVALKGMPPSERQSRIDQIKALLEDSDWTLSSSPKLWHIAREYTTVNPQTKQEEIEHRETIIQTLALKRLGDFYDRLSAIVGVEIPPQFPHLTLYTKGTDKKTSQAGIGVNTEEDFKRYNPQPIELDEAR